MKELDEYVVDAIMHINDGIKTLLNGECGSINFSADFIYTMISNNCYIGYAGDDRYCNSDAEDPSTKDKARQRLIKDESLICFKLCQDKYSGGELLFILYYVNDVLNNIAKAGSTKIMCIDDIWGCVRILYDLYGIKNADDVNSSRAIQFKRLMIYLIDNEEIYNEYIDRIKRLYNSIIDISSDFTLSAAYIHEMQNAYDKVYYIMHMSPIWHNIDITFSNC